MDKIIEGKKLPTYKYIASWEGKIFQYSAKFVWWEEEKIWIVCACEWFFSEHFRQKKRELFVYISEKLSLLILALFFFVLLICF